MILNAVMVEGNAGHDAAHARVGVQNVGAIADHQQRPCALRAQAYQFCQILRLFD